VATDAGIFTTDRGDPLYHCGSNHRSVIRG
jgi:hypothetical protein